MKNLIKFFITATILFTASCTTENLDSSIASEETVEVFFATNLADSSTRAYDDGTNVTTLHYFVCDKDDNILSGLTPAEPIVENDKDGKFSFSLNLIKSMEYNIYFWAHSGAYTISDEGVVSINYTNDAGENIVYANNGDLDAFYAAVNIPAGQAGTTQNVSLTRPFAQLNVLTSDGNTLLKNDVESFENVTSTATVEGVYSQFDLINGDVVDTSRQTVTFAPTVIPAGRKGEVTSNDNYTHLSMNYLFVPERCVANVQFTFTATRTNNAIIEVTTPNYNDVPLKPNYKTNIIGKLLTDSTEFKIDVVDEWATDDQYILAGEVTLTEDLIVAKPIIVAAGTEAVLNLNGKKIINTTESEVFGEGEGIIVYGKLIINGEGTVQGTTMAVWARGNKGAEVTINGGTYKGCAEGFAKGGRSVIYASSGNTININDGTFQALTADKTSYADKTNGVYAAVNVADNNGTINVYGGTFYKQNPAAPGTEPAAWNAAHPNGFVAEGYGSCLKADGNYVVLPFFGEVTLAENLILESGLVATSDLTLDLNGQTLKYTGNDVLFRVKNGATVTINGSEANSAIVTNPTTPGSGGNGYVGLVSENGTLNINGGVYDAQATCTIAQVIMGTLNINGGSFQVNMDKYTDAKGEASYLLNCSDGNYKNGTAKINVYGGSFYKFNPANNAAEGANTNFCAKGHSTALNEDGVTYTIIPPISVSNDNLNEVLQYLNDGTYTGNVSIVLTDDITLGQIFNVPAGTNVYLDMNGKTITVPKEADPAFYPREGSTLVIDGNGTVELTNSFLSLLYPMGDVIIENGTFVRNVPEGTPANKVGAMFVGTSPTGGWHSAGVTIKGGYFDSGYYDENANEIEEILAGRKNLVETEDDIKKRGNSGDKNKVRVALRDNIMKFLNRSSNHFWVYGGTFVGANPAWGDEGCMLPTTPQYLRPWSYYQGPLIKDQEFHEDGIVLPEGFAITKGTHEDGRPTYTVQYNK